MNFNNTTPLEKVSKLKINTSPYVEPYIEPPLTARKELDDLRESTRNFVIDNEVLYNKLQSVQNEIRDLVYFLKKLN